MNKSAEFVVVTVVDEDTNDVVTNKRHDGRSQSGQAVFVEDWTLDRWATFLYKSKRRSFAVFDGTTLWVVFPTMTKKFMTADLQYIYI